MATQKYDGTLAPIVETDGAGGQKLAIANYLKNSVPGDVAQLGTPAGRTQLAGGAQLGDAITANATATPNQTDIQQAQASMPYGVTGTSSADRLRTPSKFVPLNAVNTNAEATIWTPAAGKKFRLMRLVLASSVAGNVALKDNTAGTTIAVIPTLAGAPVVVDLGNGILSAAANNVLTATGPASSTLSGMVMGTEE